jgi:decaprenylphospho-beta-D-erythro-pentofuranosid-2-ulose 2-reductase
LTERVLLLGATSGIARSVARELAAQGHPLVLAARDVEAAERLAADLTVRFGTEARVWAFDALDFASHGALAERAAGEEVGGVVLCYGAMVDQAEAQRDPARALEMIQVNYASPVSVLERLAPVLAARGRGFVCALSSVAGDRGRPSNYLYGSTKAGLDAYLEGLRPRLHRDGVAVINVKPGVVDTGMTFGMERLPLMAPPDRVGRDVARAIRRRATTVYTPFFWRFIMLVIRALPTRLYRRLAL